MRLSLAPLSLLLAISVAMAGPPPVREPDPVVPAIPKTDPPSPSAPSPPALGSVTPAEPQAIRIRPQRTVGAKPTPQQKARSGRKRGGAIDERDLVRNQIKEAVRRPANSMMVESKTIYAYVPDAIYMIYAAINHVVDVQLQPGETLTGRISAGDTHRWDVGTVTDGTGERVTTHVLIKPKQSGIETNFLIVTDRHSYRLYAQANEDFFIPTVGWSYPDEELSKAASIKEEQRRLDGLTAAPAIIAANLNFKYRIRSKERYPWTPVRVFDDGAKTYIQMSPEMKNHEAPVFFIKDGKLLNLVNYRIRGDYFIVDRLFNEGELRSGKKDRVVIERETPWFGAADKYPEPGKQGR